MKLCLIADARSPIAQNWIRYLIRVNHEVHLISSYPCESTVLPVASFHLAPVAFSWAGVPTATGDPARSSVKTLLRQWGAATKKRFLPLLSRTRHWLGPLDVHRYVGQVSRLIAQLKPDLVHAMRIPFEGILAAEALRSCRVPLLVSVWGNDFTLHAHGSPLLGCLTKRTMARADALHPDCHRDLLLARVWGFGEAKPAIVLPSAGGVQTDLFHAGAPEPQVRAQWQIPEGTAVVLNPRGIRGYVRNDTFFQAIPLVLAKKPHVLFLGLAMQGSALAMQWVERLHLEQDRMRLLRTDHCDGDERRTRFERHPHDAAAAEALQPIALPEHLRCALHALRKRDHAPAATKEALGVLATGTDATELRQRRLDERQRDQPIGHEEARTLGTAASPPERVRDHEPIPRQ